jgi:pimeloyl-ACP methyl ester carboxylesterase
MRATDMLAMPGQKRNQHRKERTPPSQFKKTPGLVMLLLLLALFQHGCVKPLTVPIGTELLSGSEQPLRLLIIYLPGNGDAADAFKRNGLVSPIGDRQISADIVGVDAHLGYYQNGSVIERLKQDVIDPAKKRGYDRIWLVGNSLGAYGSLLYASRYPADISGIVLLGAYAGERGIIREIDGAGGLNTWEPGTIVEKDWERQLWTWLKRYRGHASEYPPVYLGYGRWDRFTYAQDLLATALPADRVVVIPGGHDWSTWKKAWSLLFEKIAVQMR